MKTVMLVPIFAICFSTSAICETPLACDGDRQTVSPLDGTQVLTKAYRSLGPDTLTDASIGGTVTVDGTSRAFRLFWSKGRFRYEVDTAAATRTLLFNNGKLIELRGGVMHSVSWNFNEELLAPIFPIVWLRHRITLKASRAAAIDREDPTLVCLNEAEEVRIGNRRIIVDHTWALDSQSGLVRSVQYSLPKRADVASRVAQRVEYSKYSDVAGRPVPLQVTVHAKGAQPAQFLITDVRLDTGVPDSHFEMLGGAK